MELTPAPASPGTQPCRLDPKRDLEKDFTEPAAAQARYSPYTHDSHHRRQARRAAILDASRTRVQRRAKGFSRASKNKVLPKYARLMPTASARSETSMVTTCRPEKRG
jgi:hypothetical protein